MGGTYDHYFGLTARAFEPGGAGYPAMLEPGAIEPYLVERLRGVGWQGVPMLDLGLTPLLHEATGGERAAIDRAMTALMEDAAERQRHTVDGDALLAWLEDDDAPPDLAPVVTDGLAEAQLEAIEGAFADHDRKLARLRRELADLREGSGAAAPEGIEERLGAIEARLDQQDAALRHVLERLIGFFEERRG